MNWIFSPAARAGLSPPEWIVAAILIAFLSVGAFEMRGDAEHQAPILTRKQKWVATAMLVPLLTLLGLLVWRQLIR
jgi:hypothetical protein